MNTKIENGQFYTLRNPFNHPLVKEWETLIPPASNFTEPFAGANNIPKLFMEVFPHRNIDYWSSYDIEPEAIRQNEIPELPLIKKDTIQYPVKSDVVVTNPPYLAKNSAKRMKMNINFHDYQDLYELSLSKILANTQYVAAIIPESFLTRKLFRDRLYGFISITTSLFDDTDFPVSLALWTPQSNKDYYIYIGNTYIGKYHEIINNIELLKVVSSNNIKIQYNDPHGILGLKAVDNTKTQSITFIPGDQIDPTTIKNTSRAITRISIMDDNGNNIITEDNIEEFINILNKLLSTYREQSHDLLLTSFKGLRADGRYRRRLDWKTTTKLINYSLTKLGIPDDPQQKRENANLFDLLEQENHS